MTPDPPPETPHVTPEDTLHVTPEDTLHVTPEGTPPADADTGLLAPGRAGCAVEAATGDTAFLQALLDAEAALTHAQAVAGLAPTGAAAAVAAAADAALFDARDIALRARGAGNPVVPLVADLTTAVERNAGAYAEYVHRGATSQDILDTALMLMASRTLALIHTDLTRTATALARLAATHRATAMPGRTVTQHAVPTTFGLKAAGWRSLVLDARDRLAGARDALPCQLGGAAGTLAAFCAWGPPSPAEGAPAGTAPVEEPTGTARAVEPTGTAPAVEPVGTAHIDRMLTAYAHRLGLRRPDLPWHTLRTPIVDLAAALAFTTTALGKPAADVAILSRSELAEVGEGRRGASSAMPHKANPVLATLISAAAHRAPALAATLYGSLAAEDERPAGAWHAEWEPLRELLRLCGGAVRDAAELAEGLRVHPDAMRAHLGLTHGLIVSERLSAALAPRLGRARAGALLTEAARRAEQEGRELTALLAELPLVRDLGLDLVALGDPARYIGLAPDLTDRALERS